MINFFGAENKFSNVLATVILVFVISLIGTAITSSIFTDGKVTHCYVDKLGVYPAYQIIGHRDWRPDAILSVEKTSEEANEKMKQICP